MLKRKEKLSLDDRDGDWESNCKKTILTNNQLYQGKANNSRSKYDREIKKQQSVLQLVSQPSKSWESKDVVFQKMKPKIDKHISWNILL
jgi:hypothetical protein